MNSKMLDIYEAITDILDIFVQTEVGTDVEYNNEVIANYISSSSCVLHYFECATKEAIYERFTQDILEGYPVWQMLNLPAWTRTMLERDFQKEEAIAQEVAEKKYKCLTCKYFYQRETEFGLLCKCLNEESSAYKNCRYRTKGIIKQLRTRCKQYSANEKGVQNDKTNL